MAFRPARESPPDIPTNHPAARDFQAKSPPVFFQAFDDFIDSGKNANALLAARLACESNLEEKTAPANFLIFYGAPGTGKTHLLKAMQKALLDLLKPASVYFRDAVNFCQEDDLMASFRGNEGFWQNRALLLDNLQELTGYTHLQNKLASCLGARNGGLAAFAWTGQAQDLSALEKNLASRLAAALLVRLEEPDLATRLSFLERECQKLGLNKTLLLWLARRASTFPALQGLIARIRFFISANNKTPDIDELEDLANEQGSSPGLGWRQIMKTVAARLKISPEDILGSERKADFVLARQLAMYLCRKRLGLSFPELGRLFGGRDHSTVIHSIKKMEKALKTDKVLHNLLTELEATGFMNTSKLRQ